VSGGGLPAALEETATLLRGESVTSRDEPRLLRFLLDRRLGAEAAALPGISTLSRASRRELAVERERVRSAATTRAIAVDRAARGLAEAGLAAVLLKGEAVVELTHGDASRRPMGDIDVLVRPSEREPAVAALCAAGFERTTADTALHAVLVDRAARGPGHPHGVAIEVHEDVLEPPHPFGLDLEGVRQRASAHRGGLLLPSLEDAIALTSFQLVVHETDGRKTLLHLRDVALLLDALARGDATASPAPIAARLGVAPIVAAVVERAVAFAGAPPGAVAWCGEIPPLRRRRRLALWLALHEMDAGLLAPAPRAREFSRRVSVMLWHETWRESVVAMLRALRRKGAWGSVSRRLRALNASSRSLGA
jgi:hypothetical protein